MAAGSPKRARSSDSARNLAVGQPGRPGEEPGEDYLETEIELAELVEMMLEDIGLPNLRQKEIQEAVISKGWKYDSIEKHGIASPAGQKTHHQGGDKKNGSPGAGPDAEFRE